MTPIPPQDEAVALREQLAALCHEQWSGWMEYLFAKCKVKDDGQSMLIPPWAVDRWVGQMKTPYAELSESEKDSDRKEADRFLAIVGPALRASESAREELEKEVARLTEERNTHIGRAYTFDGCLTSVSKLANDYKDKLSAAEKEIAELRERHGLAKEAWENARQACIRAERRLALAEGVVKATELHVKLYDKGLRTGVYSLRESLSAYRAAVEGSK